MHLGGVEVAARTDWPEDINAAADVSPLRCLDAKAEDDLVLEKAGATVVIDPVSVQYMEGSEIDFVDDLMGAAFKIKNPLATASCGCGTSFSL